MFLLSFFFSSLFCSSSRCWSVLVLVFVIVLTPSLALCQARLTVNGVGMLGYVSYEECQRVPLDTSSGTVGMEIEGSGGECDETSLSLSLSLSLVSCASTGELARCVVVVVYQRAELARVGTAWRPRVREVRLVVPAVDGVVVG